MRVMQNLAKLTNSREHGQLAREDCRPQDIHRLYKCDLRESSWNPHCLVVEGRSRKKNSIQPEAVAMGAWVQSLL